MTRKEMYTFIKDKGLQDYIKSTTKAHYTNCSNEVLEDIINQYMSNQTFSTESLNNSVIEDKEDCNCEYKSKYEKLLNALASCLVSLDSEIDKDIADAYTRIKDLIRNC